MKYYKVKLWLFGNPEIQEIEVEKETESSVWVNGSRNAKRSGYIRYVLSIEEAKTILMTAVDREVNKHNDQINTLKQFKQKVNNFKA